MAATVKGLGIRRVAMSHPAATVLKTRAPREKKPVGVSNVCSKSVIRIGLMRSASGPCGPEASP